jgi:hypothetical protein
VNASEPLMTCRKRSRDIKTEGESLPREEPGGYLLTDQVVSGMKVARTWLRLLRETSEPVAPIPVRPVTASCGHPAGESETSTWQKPRGAE